jgi:5'-3' exonuclease
MNIILIDGSYFCFYRYHSLVTWWKNAYPTEIDVLKNPCENATFVEKFRKTFVSNIKNIPNGIKLDKTTEPIIIIGKDCKRQNIWRNKLFSNYKANRTEDEFMGGDFFRMAYEDNLFIQGGAQLIVEHPVLEADDCIAISVKNLLHLYPECNIYVITSDKDYLQLAQERVQIYNLGFKKITDLKSSTGNSDCDLFCKILTGDKSDNIPSVFPKCGTKTAIKYYNDKELLNKKLLESDIFKTQYELNKTIIDFNCIPQDLYEEFINVYYDLYKKLK